MVEYFGTPFYLMENPSKSNSDKWPQNKQEVIDGLEEAIRNTKKRITDLRRVNADISEFEFHLKALEDKTRKVRENREGKYK